MKSLITTLLIFLTTGIGISQQKLDNIELTIREDINLDPFGDFIVNVLGYTAYTVYARPLAEYNTSYNLGNTQITVVLPEGIQYYGPSGGTNTGSMFVTSTDGGTWSNQDVNEGVDGKDYHAVASSGALINGGNPPSAGTEYKLYTVYVFGDCNESIRLFNNGADPDSDVMPGGGDFRNNFIHQIAAGSFSDEYMTNYTSGTPVCLPALPVEYKSFTAEKDGRKAILEWTTAVEINNDYFEVLRSSDGKEWKVIGMVNGSGTTQESAQYDFVDSNPLLGNNYYRLNQVDLDGASELSEIKKLSFDNGSDALAVKYFPNPAYDRLRITTNQATEGNMLYVTHITGKVLRTINYTDGMEISLSGLDGGIYLVRMVDQSGQVISIQKIIKKSE